MHSLPLFAMLAGVGLSAVVSPSLRVVPMALHRRGENTRNLMRRSSGTQSVSMTNSIAMGGYYVNATVGSPGQPISFQLDTGSSDLWMFSPAACSEAQCFGGTFDPEKSSTYQNVTDLGTFEITYDTPGSGVKGVYFSDDFNLGAISLTDVTMALATEAKQSPHGIMGIGLLKNEAIYGESDGKVEYNNVIVKMKQEGAIASESYSLWLDDIEASTGTLLFGGYDSAKYTEPLTVLDMVPTDGFIFQSAVSWTYLGISDSKGTTLVGTEDFPLAAVLDSGTTLTSIPPNLFYPLANYFGVESSNGEFPYLVDCSIADWEGALDYGFGAGSAVIQVPFSELALNVTNSNGSIPTLSNGNPGCGFGIQLGSNTGDILLGDTFLRSAYVIYDLEALQVAIAQTVFGTSDSSIAEIPSGGDLASILGTKAQAATSISAVPSHVIPNATISLVPSATSSVNGVQTTLALTSTVTGGIKPSSTSSKGAAPTGLTPNIESLSVMSSLMAFVAFFWF